ncbi:hypothetical protein B0T09DRAFT_352594, partial [Sordaria sp. MPI-SDFR-AT-0083]
MKPSSIPTIIVLLLVPIHHASPINGLTGRDVLVLSWPFRGKDLEGHASIERTTPRISGQTARASKEDGKPKRVPD